MIRRRNPPPMPIHLVMEDPRALALHAAGAGMLARLSIHYWLTDCHPLPHSDYALCQLARAHKPTWYQERETIKAILKDVLPQLQRARQVNSEKRASLERLRDKSASVRKLATHTRKAPIATDPAPVVQPKRKQANREPAIKPLIDSGWQD